MRAYMESRVLYIATSSTSCFSSDASGNWGCGAWHSHLWFQWKWGTVSIQLPIFVKELLPILLAAIVWGRLWHAQKVLCYCDNQAVVAVLQSRSSKHYHIMHLLRCLFFVEAYFHFSLVATYVTSKDNNIADDLSRNNLSSFFSKVPTASKAPAQI